MKGLFITLEGIDGSGKSTLAEGLYKSLKVKGVDVILTKAPGGTPSGALMREMILHGKISDLKAELFLFLADRAEHVTTVIKPEVAFHRLEKHRASKDRIENEGLYLLTRIDQAYRDIIKHTDRIISFDGGLSVSELLETSLDYVLKFIEKRS